MAALVVGAIPALKGLFFGPQALLRVLTDVLNILGMAMIPSMMLVLGGNLSRGPVAVEMRARTVVGITVTRLVILPLLGIGVVQLADRGGLLPAGDPMFRFVLMLQFAMPTAINLGTVAALHGYGEKEASLILFWQYLLATLTMMVFILAAGSWQLAQQASDLGTCAVAAQAHMRFLLAPPAKRRPLLVDGRQLAASQQAH
eukprot:jgi/Mesen1/10059/ME000730S09343